MGSVHVIGAGMTKFGHLEESIIDLARNASLRALEDAQASGEKIDHILVASQNPDEFTGIGHLSTLMADSLGIVPAGGTRIESGPSSGASAVEAGFAMIRSGLAELVLVVGMEKMSEVSRERASAILAKMISKENEARYGATPASLAALIARRYMHDYGLTRDELSLVPVKAHRNGARNPLAHFQKEITVEKVNASPIVSSPLTLFDCCPTSDGAASVVLASAEKARKLGVIGDSATFKGIGHATDFLAVQHRESLTSLSATVNAARDAFRMAKTRPEDIDVFELHDAFSILEIIDIEDMGLAKQGKGIEIIKSGDVEVDGKIPINTTGGLKARGHPTGATGVAQIRDIFLQLTNRAPGSLQVPNAHRGLTHNIGGFGNNMIVTIFESNSI
ncbi:thiolase domain-containing protein [Candidatus Thorarchaeota archaeon]|nr:MAG: thiolase domain-containing protein [Candidatus Thorarchaeota archaeon]